MNEMPKASRAERRREKQRLHIIAQAQDIFFENGGEDGGFERTTVEAIAERSDISLSTFFRYFESKLDVIYLDSKQALIDLERSLSARLLEEPPLSAALNARLDQLQFFCSDENSLQRLRRAFGAPQFRDRLHILRGNSEILIAKLIAPHLDGSPSIQKRHARLIAVATTATISTLVDPNKLSPDTDFEAESIKVLEELQSLLAMADTSVQN